MDMEEKVDFLLKISEWEVNCKIEKMVNEAWASMSPQDKQNLVLKAFESSLDRIIVGKFTSSYGAENAQLNTIIQQVVSQQFDKIAKTVNEEVEKKINERLPNVIATTVENRVYASTNTYITNLLKTMLEDAKKKL
jgi:hypothetical protein